MAGELNSLRKGLRTAFRDYWENSSEAQRLKNDLAEAFPDSDEEGLRVAFRECMDKDDVPSCLRDAANADHLGTDFLSDWGQPQFRQIKTDLQKKARDEWSDSDRQAVLNIANQNNIRQLYKWCSNDQQQKVADALNIDKPSGYRNCATAVAEAKDLGNQLRDLWGKGFDMET